MIKIVLLCGYNTNKYNQINKWREKKTEKNINDDYNGDSHSNNNHHRCSDFAMGYNN